MSTWPQLLVERQKGCGQWGGALPKILEAYIGDAALQTDPPEHTRQFAPSGCNGVLARL